MNSNLLSKSFAIPFACMVALLPVLSVSSAVPPVFEKGVLAAMVLGGCLLATALNLVWRRHRTVIPISAVVYVGIALFVAVCVSAAWALSFKKAWWGLEFETGTAGSVALFTAALFAGSLLSARSMLITLYVFIASTLVAFLYSTVGVLHGQAGTIEAIAGSWVTLSFLLGASLLGAALLADHAESRRRVIMHWALFLILFVGFLLFFHFDAALITLGSAIFAIGLSVGRRTDGSRHLPFATLALVVFLLLCVVVGMRAPLVPLPTEVHPTAFAVELVMTPAFLNSTQSMLIGIGPNNFRNTWNKYRIQDANTTAFSNMEPTVGSSVFMTWLMEFGVLGLVPLLVLYALLLYCAWHIASERLFSNIPRKFGLRTTMLVLSMFFMGTLLFSAPEIPALLFAALTLGFAVSTPLLPQNMLPIPRFFLFRIALATLFVAGGMILVWVAWHQFAAARCYAAGIDARVRGDLQAAARSLGCAAETWSAALYEYQAARAWLDIVKEQSKEPSDPTALSRTIDRAIALANRATNSDLGDYSVWLSCAFLYITVMPTNYPEAELRARECLEQGWQHAPTRPEVPFLEAQFYIAKHDIVSARKALETALRLKPDYEPAQTLLKSLSNPVP